ncbi:hypothetical protein [Streptomyces sp. NPDC053431]
MKKLLVAAAITLSVIGVTSATAVADAQAPRAQYSTAGDPACC